MSTTTNARDLIKAGEFDLALTELRETLHRFLDEGADPEGTRLLHILSKPSYGNLAAAFDAEDVLKLMERASRRAWAEDAAKRELFNPDRRIAAHWETLKAMRWLRGAVEQDRSIELVTLRIRAENARITKVKSRLLWMEKVGTVHFSGDSVGAGRAPDLPKISDPVGDVPLFKSYYTSIGDMDDIQLAFFQDFEKRHLAGDYVELEGQWSYAFAFLSKVEENLDENYQALRSTYERFEQEYPDTTLAQACKFRRASVHFLLNDWQGGFDVLNPTLPMDVYVTLAPMVEDDRLQAATVEGWMLKDHMITGSAHKLKHEVDQVLQSLLDAAHSELGCSIVFDLWQRLFVERGRGTSTVAVAEECGGFITQEEIDSYLEHHDAMIERDLAYPSPKFRFGGPLHGLDWPLTFCRTYWFSQIVRARMRSLYRDAENIARSNAGLPAVGEAWVSEVLLLRLVREAFPEYRVLHQGRPGWLGLQSLDIYLPDQNIGIEYQGVQHSSPVNRFGGQLAYERQLERDARKRALCQENGCQLVEVQPDYQLAEVIAEIQEAVDL
ncbi:hypothetical protein [Salinibacterium sp. SWN1162]|uniref:hypothetical protein n=1 Tax=Salinibacterium sp. SWN1162 TaxID=2792053 RepID=UPI0018CD09BF|nr:hypothetical protein [Salinibacterium sp. SWN1162]MBH0009570.1 hypothetical protein [Salinibacterium sp. SWN1162]